MIKKFRDVNLKTKFIFTFFSIVLISILLVGIIALYKINNTNYDLAISKEKEIISTVSKDIEVFIENIPKDLYFLSTTYSFERYLMWRSIGENTMAEEKKSEVIDTFRSFLISKQYIYKIRFINNYGLEQLSLKYDDKSKNALVTNDDELQNLSKEYFFTTPLNYQKNKLFISSLDLNTENEKIVYPYIPVIRFSIPLYDEHNNKHGVFIINAYAKYILDRINEYQNDLEKNMTNIYLTDENGYYLLNKDEEKLWGKDLKNSNTLKVDNPKFFEKIQNNDFGTFDDGSYIYSFKKIYPSLDDKSKYWTVYTVADKEFVLKDVNYFKALFLSLIIATIIIVLFIINRFIFNLIRPLSNISEHLNILAKGKLPKNDIEYKNNDEIRKMIDSLEVLSNSLSSTIKQTQLIANGDYTKKINLLSNEDTLGISINNMTEKLKTNYEVEKLNKWFSDGLNKLSRKLNAEMSFEDLSNNSISYLCRYLNVGKGVFYTFDDATFSLNLTGSFMHTSRDTLGNSYRLGEGSIGQVGVEKKPILLTNPETSINLGLNDIKAKNSFTYPLIYENELYGVLEIISSNDIDKNMQEFIEKASEIIATYLYSIKQRYEVNKLLDYTKKSEEILRTQSEELQESNTQMLEQQQLLEEQQQQLEEANAQMEEQQQQLEANAHILKEKNRVLVLSEKELDKRAKDLELSNKYKSEFLANMSHELRTPLNSIILLSDMLASNSSNNLSTDDVKKATVINKSGNDLLRLINDVLDLSKVEAGKMQLIVDKFSSMEFLQDIKDLFEHNANEKNIELKIEDYYKNDLYTDRDKLAQIIKNLMSNALKFTKQGSVSLRIEEENEQIKISVKDTGIGIPQEKQKLIFEAFTQADGSTSREYGGTGLGLSICKELAKLLKGSISVSSDENGSIFSIYIPNLKDEKIEEVKINEIKNDEVFKELKDDRNTLKKYDKTFLIIEDDESLAKIVREKINLENENAIIANSGFEGLELARKYNILGVLLDLGLPDIDGVDLLREFKTDAKLKDIPIHIISGKDILSQDVKEADGFSPKPITADEIKTIVNNFKEKAQKKIKNILIVEDNIIQREAIKEYLSSLDSIVSFAVGSTNEAIEQINKNTYDCIILDLNLEDGSGLDICKYLSNNNIKTPTIIYTGKSLSANEEQHLRRFTDSIIIKTVQSKERLIDELNIFLFNKKNSKKSDNELNLDLHGKKILLADDDIRNIYVLTELLESKGANVVIANNGEEAINQMSEEKDVDLILLDIMMPIMDGYEVAKRLKSDDNTKNIPIIALTAKAMAEDRTKALNAGCDDYLTKPLNINVLSNIIMAWLKKTKK